MSAVGIIFANLHERNIPELTRSRAMASVPFGGRYRLIDFPLAYMVNAGITDIRVITHSHYSSLMDHIGSGKDWDLARRSGGIKLLPPYINEQAATDPAPLSRLQSLKNISIALDRLQSDFVVLSDCDAICNPDIDALLQQHAQSGTQITMLVRRTVFSGAVHEKISVVDFDKNGRITGVLVNPIHMEGERYRDLNIWVVNTPFLQHIVREAIARGYTSLNRDILARYCDRYDFRAIEFGGFFACITSFSDYFMHSMELLENHTARQALFGIKDRPIYTKLHNTAPAYYAPEAIVKNSIIADGCQIEGVVENSVLFRGVQVGPESVVRNCVLFQNTIVDRECFLNCIVSDKNAVIEKEQLLAGHPSLPYFIDKGRVI